MPRPEANVPLLGLPRPQIHGGLGVQDLRLAGVATHKMVVAPTD
jgi:hypothetical protein